MQNITTISIDLAKTVFQVALFNKYGTLKSNNKMNQSKMVQLIVQHPEALINTGKPPALPGRLT